MLGDEEDWILPLTRGQMAGLPPSLRDAAAATAKDAERGRALRRHPVALQRRALPAISPTTAPCASRLFRAWVARGDNDNAHNNNAIIAETLALARRARRPAGL